MPLKITIPTTLVIHDERHLAVELRGHQVCEQLSYGKPISIPTDRHILLTLYSPGLSQELSQTFLHDHGQIVALLAQLGFAELKVIGSRRRRTYASSTWCSGKLSAHITKHTKYGTPSENGEFYRLLIWGLGLDGAIR